MLLCNCFSTVAKNIHGHLYGPESDDSDTNHCDQVMVEPMDYAGVVQDGTPSMDASIHTTKASFVAKPGARHSAEVEAVKTAHVFKPTLMEC